MNWKKKLATCTIIVAITTFVIHLINRLIYFMETVDNLLGRREGLFYEWRFGKIFYTKEGKGKPILLIHDLTACSSEYEWHRISSELTKTNTVYTIDLLGCGKSEKPNFTYTNFLYVQLVTDFIKNVIGEKADVIVTGNSSPFVIMACKNDPTVIDRLIMINPPSIASTSQNPSKRTKLLKVMINLPIIGTLLFNLLHSKEHLEQTFMTEYFYKPELVDDELIKTYCEAGQTSKTQSKYLFASIKGRYTNANITECLKAIDNSIFILTGDGNPTYKEVAKQYKSYTPSIEIEPIGATKLLPQLEAPEQVLDQIKIFFEL